MLTIGMPVYNDVLFIEQSIQSILNQTYTNFELIISDDCSTDGSELICREYASKDSRIKYIRQAKNIGISRNMEHLYKLAQTQYFMWAGDDDIVSPYFVEKLIQCLEDNPDSISAFCDFHFIDEKNSIIGDKLSFDYSEKVKVKRLKKFISNSNDIFGYGIFVREKIKDVKFPIWWWPNKKCPYNNIFPSLCYYLSIGNYAHFKGEALFFKREKTLQKTNYITSYSTNGLLDSCAFILRRINLFLFSLKMISKGSNIVVASLVSPNLFWNWVFLSSLEQMKITAKALKTKLMGR